jgi:(R,R)-butanediol dehydrogenase/meso-butanediol dehydrogenase/diacetyl reductase/L-iditol 2-dehydrogenase
MLKSAAVVKTGSLKDADTAKRGRVSVRDIPVPETGDEDVKIKVAYCSICGSDPHLVEGIFGWAVPFGIGHEVSGVIVELGKKAVVNGLKVGDRVAGNFLHFCGSCYYCRNGQQQFCESVPEGNSGMSEYVVWHESQVFKLPDDISLKKGCLLEPISIAVRIADKINMKIGKRIAINGSGPIGLLTMQVLKMYGATSLTMFEPVASRRAAALELGADYVVDPLSEDVVREALRLTDNRGYDVVIDASGAIKAATVLPEITAKGGTLVYGAMYPNTYEMPLNLYKYCYLNELTITGFFVSPYTFPRALQILTKMKLDKFCDTAYRLDQVEDAFAAHISGNHLKILIQCNDDIAGL